MGAIRDILEKNWPDVLACYTPDIIERLETAYREPQRTYHSTTHIVDLLQKLETYKHLALRPDLIVHAILWHDAVYRTSIEKDGTHVYRPDKDNVEDSARWFEATPCKLSNDDRAQVAHMIRATAGHIVTPDHPYFNDIALFLDLDLSVLALPFDEFQKNTEIIRQEYPHISEYDFCTGRADFFDTYGKKENLFYHPTTSALFNEQARKNMAAQTIYLRQKAASLDQKKL